MKNKYTVLHGDRQNDHESGELKTLLAAKRHGRKAVRQSWTNGNGAYVVFNGDTPVFAERCRNGVFTAVNV